MGSVIAFLGIYPKEINPARAETTCTKMVVPVVFLIAENWKQPKCPLVGDQLIIYALATRPLDSPGLAP